MPLIYSERRAQNAAKVTPIFCRSCQANRAEHSAEFFGRIRRSPNFGPSLSLNLFAHHMSVRWVTLCVSKTVSLYNQLSQSGHLFAGKRTECQWKLEDKYYTVSVSVTSRNRSCNPLSGSRLKKRRSASPCEWFYLISKSLLSLHQSTERFFSHRHSGPTGPELHAGRVYPRVGSGRSQNLDPRPTLYWTLAV